MQEYIRLLNQFNRFPTLCNLLQLVAYDTWQRVEFGRTRTGFKVFETTITQNILYMFRVYCDLYPQIPMRMFEAINERDNGNDIELIIQTSQGFIIAPLQAKIIYATGNYPSMEHGNQINDLITYANRVGGVPLYLLYNYYSDNTFNHDGNKCGIIYTKEQFGCSLVSANYLHDNFAFNRKDRSGNSRWTIPNFVDLHPSVAIPWFVLGCCRNYESNALATINLINNSPKTGGGFEQRVTTYEYEELINDTNWRPLAIKGLNLTKDLIDIENTKFSPKYRIVFEFDEQKHNL